MNAAPLTEPVAVSRLSARRETVRFATGHCWLSGFLIAASAKGICALTLGDDAAALAADLRKRFPGADFAEPEIGSDPDLTRAAKFLDASENEIDFPLDLRGTDFQQRVWRALREIPFGKTASYTEIAEKLGTPNAVRAVAQACGANPVAVAVPCHRVLRRDGALSGYRWGIERKRLLLDRELRYP